MTQVLNSTTDNTTVDPKTTSTTSADSAAAAKTQAEPSKVEADAAAAKATADAKDKEGTEPTPEQKAEAEAKAKADADRAKLVGAPEKYEAFAAPKGITLDSQLVDEFTPLAKDLNLSQEGAQKMADFGSKLIQKQQEATAKLWVDTRAKWTSEIKADKEIGGNNFTQSKEIADRGLAHAMKTIPGLKAVIDQGWFDNPALFALAILHGKTVREDRLIGGTPAPDRELSQAEKLYGPAKK